MPSLSSVSSFSGYGCSFLKGRYDLFKAFLVLQWHGFFKNDGHSSSSIGRKNSLLNFTLVQDIYLFPIFRLTLPSWAEFELGSAPVFWKTMNGLPLTSGESLTLFYNPAANNLVQNEEFGIAFNGGFNQPIMCGGEPRVMRIKERGEDYLPIYTVKIQIPKHAVSLIFSFTNGAQWDGPYKLQFQVLKKWRNKPLVFFNEGDRCKLDLVMGCMDPNSPSYNPFANVDDGSCPAESDSEEE